jgi:hypothetical protein
MSGDAKLGSLVERYKVCWDSFPEWSRVGGERRQTGVVVEIYGTHELPGVVPTAGCERCFPVMQALLAIADDVVEPVRKELTSIRAHSGIEYAVERGARPDIVVGLTFAGPEADSAEARPPIDEVRKRLERLGATERSWRPRPGPSDRGNGHD